NCSVPVFLSRATVNSCCTTGCEMTVTLGHFEVVMRHAGECIPANCDRSSGFVQPAMREWPLLAVGLLRRVRLSLVLPDADDLPGTLLHLCKQSSCPDELGREDRQPHGNDNESGNHRQHQPGDADQHNNAADEEDDDLPRALEDHSDNSP